MATLNKYPKRIRNQIMDELVKIEARTLVVMLISIIQQEEMDWFANLYVKRKDISEM